MQLVDHKGMGVAAIVSAPAAVLPSQVRVVRRELRVLMLDDLRIGGRPEPGGKAGAEQGQRSQPY
jgi:hypothetical protein